MRLGIDLGTTRTIVAANDRGNVPIIAFEDPHGDLSEHVPTVSAERDGQLIHGFEAADAALRGAPHLRSWKRLIAAHGPEHRVQIGSVDIALLDVAQGFASYLRELLLTRSNLPLSRIDEVAVSVPANAHSSQRFTTLEAFRRAGFSVMAMLNEPSAAAIEYAHRHRGTLNTRRDHVAIYDLGGGTFDAALVEVGDDHHDIVDTLGIHQLGGDDFDRALLVMVLAALGIDDPAEISDRLPALLWACREAKEQIGPNTRRVVIDVERLGLASEPLLLSVNDYFERLRPMVERTIAALSEVMQPGGATAQGVDDLKERAREVGLAGVYVVGGASALPLVPRMLRERLGRRVHRSPHPAGAIAMGLAIAVSDERRPQVDERLSRHLGVFREADHGGRIVFDQIFARGTPMPQKGETLLATRAYRAAHNVGHFRFLECAGVRDGEPDGDISPHGEVLFPFVREARNGRGVQALDVARSSEPGHRIEERYQIDDAGVVTVEICDLDDDYTQRFVL